MFLYFRLFSNNVKFDIIDLNHELDRTNSSGLIIQIKLFYPPTIVLVFPLKDIQIAILKEEFT